MSFKFLENIAIADIAFEAAAPTVNELFEEAGKAVTDIMVDSKTITVKKEKALELGADSLETLLYDFLSEFIYIKDTEGFLAKKMKVKVNQGNNHYTLTALLQGEVIDRKRHDLRNDLKAITMHMFYVKKEGKEWKARVVVDI